MGVMKVMPPTYRDYLYLSPQRGPIIAQPGLTAVILGLVLASLCMLAFLTCSADQLFGREHEEGGYTKGG